MYFNKFAYPANFGYVARGRGEKPTRAGQTTVRFDVAAFQDGIFRITAVSKQWPVQHSQAQLDLPKPAANGDAGPRLEVGDGMALTLRDRDGQTLLTSPAGMTFGASGDASVFLFHRTPDCQFYGMGEKTFGLEQSGRRTKFWNTDAWGDFAGEVCRTGRPDPYYVSIPYLIVKRGNAYVGLLLNNPHATFVNTDSVKTWTGVDATEAAYKDCFWIGAEAGLPELYLLVGPSLAELTAKLQRLVGVTPQPPAWALGYHQCRWGYASARDLETLDASFRQHEIPCDGLWLDIGYMDAFRVFTCDKGRFPKLRATLSSLRRHGRHVVPILDPGVKLEPGFPVYDQGHRADVFCRNAAGGEFVGMVWPGETVFPDFSTDAGRTWWAGQVRRFADNGFDGAWLDMNDPSTGHIDPQGMLFDHGRKPHDTFHNQFALGMAQASREGFIRSTGERSFLLCRSGFISSSRHTAIWTGDNVSNYHYLRMCIAGTLNLALSGQPFNAPDIGGFGDDTRLPLFIDWMKCCFLFPVCRVHTSMNTARQEPWAFGDQGMAVLRHYIRLRYKLRPYLYNLFAAQEQRGTAILRPLIHDFADTPALPLGRVDDQFLVGPALMQAPFVDEGLRARSVTLPASRWYDVAAAAWVEGGRVVQATANQDTTPLYVRDGSIVPMAAGEIESDNSYDGRRVEFHLFVSPQGTETATTDYVYDDGVSFDYRRGKRSCLRVTARVAGATMHVTTRYLSRGFGPCKPAFVLYDGLKKLVVNGHPVRGHRATWSCAGVAQPVWTSAAARS